MKGMVNLMKLKPNARNSMEKELSKTIQSEGIDSIKIENLSDRELKDLYLKLQVVRSGRCAYGLKKGNDFEEDMENGNLQYVSFTNTYKLGVKRLTFKEFLMLEDFVKTNPSSKYLNIIKY